MFDELRPMEAPLGWRRIAIDSVAALLAAAFTLIMLQEGGLGAAQSGFRPLDTIGVVLALVSTVPLFFPRRWPEVAFGLSAASTLAMIALNYAVDVPPGALIAAFVLADTIDGESILRRRLALAAVTAFVPVAVGLMVLNDLKIQGMSSGFAAWATMFALVWLAGDRNRLRRDRITELVVSARLRDLDLQGQRRLAAAEERTRIARELHDSAGHAINVILVQAGAARLLHERDPDRSRRAIETIEEVAHATIADIDRLVRALRQGSGPADPAPTDTTALEQLVDRHRASGLDVSATFHGAPRGLPSGVAWAAYRILQEALTNAARHGSGSAEVRMSYGSSAVDIEVNNPIGSSRAGGIWSTSSNFGVRQDTRIRQETSVERDGKRGQDGNDDRDGNRREDVTGSKASGSSCGRNDSGSKGEGGRNANGGPDNGRQGASRQSSGGLADGGQRDGRQSSGGQGHTVECQPGVRAVGVINFAEDRPVDTFSKRPGSAASERERPATTMPGRSILNHGRNDDSSNDERDETRRRSDPNDVRLRVSRAGRRGSVVGESRGSDTPGEGSNGGSPGEKRRSSGQDESRKNGVLGESRRSGGPGENRKSGVPGEDWTGNDPDRELSGSRLGSGLGIVGMRERVALLDGSLEVDTAEGEIFRLRAQLPYAAPAGVGAFP